MVTRTRELEANLLARPVSERIRLLRQLHGWSQGDLAELMKVARTTVNKWERRHTLPRARSRRRLAELFGVSLDVLTATDPPVKQAGGRSR